jgi:hypothetical protein
MKKICMALILTTILILALSGLAFSADNNDIPEPVMKAANEGLSFVANTISANPSLYTIDTNFDAKTAKLGDGFNLYYPSKDKLCKNNTDSLIDACFASKFWLFTVKANGKPITFLTIGYEDGKYKVVEFGGKSQTFEETLTNFKKLTSNDKPKVVKIGFYYYLVNKTNSGELVLPAIPEERAMQFNNKKLINSKDIIKELKKGLTKEQTQLQYGDSTLLSVQIKGNTPIL